MQYAVLKSDGDIDAFFFIRDSGSIPAKFREKDGSREKEKLERLKKEVLAKSAEGLCTADSYSDMAQLGSRVQERLMDMLDRRFPANTDRNAFDEILQRQEFERERLRSNYVSPNRISSLDEVFRKGRNITVVIGEEGIGKSALLANWHTDDKIRMSGKDWQIIRTSADERTCSPDKLTALFFYQLKRLHSDFPAPEDAGIVWIIDGLEKINVESPDEYRYLFAAAEQISNVQGTCRCRERRICSGGRQVLQ